MYGEFRLLSTDTSGRRCPASPFWTKPKKDNSSSSSSPLEWFFDESLSLEPTSPSPATPCWLIWYRQRWPQPSVSRIRGSVIRLTMTMRGGDRPKNAHEEFTDVSVMPRSMWEPWVIVRKPLEGRVQDNLRKWKTGGWRRPSPTQPFGDVIKSSPTSTRERAIAPHPSLKTPIVFAPTCLQRYPTSRRRSNLGSLRRLGVDPGCMQCGWVSQYRDRERRHLRRLSEENRSSL